MTDQIRAVLDRHGRLTTNVWELDPASDLYEAGMSSHASVTVMLALEDEFDVEFPDSMLTRASFESIAAISDSLSRLEVAV